MLENMWIPIEQDVPKDSRYVLMSFSNFSVPMVGRYEEDQDGGGNFFIGDDTEPCIKEDLYVNAWMPLPECYEDA